MEERTYGKSYLSPVNASKYMIRMLLSILLLQRKWQRIEVSADEQEDEALAVAAHGGER